MTGIRAMTGDWGEMGRHVREKQDSARGSLNYCFGRSGRFTSRTPEDKRLLAREGKERTAKPERGEKPDGERLIKDPLLKKGTKMKKAIHGTQLRFIEA